MVEFRQLSYHEARDRVLGATRPLPPESVPLADALRRALRGGVVAGHPLPPFTNSSMDGYAVRTDDLADATADRPALLPVVEVVPAGRVATRALGPGEAIRIMTGAAIPPGADAVVPFEDAERIAGASEQARFTRPVPPGTSVRAAGDDLGAGAEALEGGRELSPHDLALLAGLGIAQIEVGRAPRVTVLSTGDELLAPGEALRPGAIRDSNVPLLDGLLREAGCRVLRTARLPDDPAPVAAAIRQALEVSDVVISIGGVSAGDFDPVKESLATVGEIELWRVAMKPGRPQAFGAPNGRLFFGLPGNPASVACVFEALVRPALRKLQGHVALDRPRVLAVAGEEIESRAGRTDFVRVTLEWRAGVLHARPAGAQVSGHLTPQSRAHALLVVPEAAARLSPGDPAEALVLRLPNTPSA